MNGTVKIGKVEVDHCAMCSVALVNKRGGTKTCSPRCRKALSRAKAKITRYADYAIYHTSLIAEYLVSEEFRALSQHEIGEILKHVQLVARRAGVQVVR